MGKQFPQLDQKHIEFISKQQLFFVATAGADGFVNLSPKGLDTLRVQDASTILWLNLTGSGNETAAHVLENGRMTLMFCSFGKQAMILRTYGHAQTIHPRDAEWSELSNAFPDHPGKRQIFRLQIKMVQTSCGYAVPFYDYQGERSSLAKWTQNLGESGLPEYWEKKNLRSLDGKQTGISGA